MWIHEVKPALYIEVSPAVLLEVNRQRSPQEVRLPYYMPPWLKLLSKMMDKVGYLSTSVCRSAFASNKSLSIPNLMSSHSKVFCAE